MVTGLSGLLVGTDGIILFLITRAGKKMILPHTVSKLFLQRTYSDTQVSLRFTSKLCCYSKCPSHRDFSWPILNNEPSSSEQFQYSINNVLC